MNLIRSFSELRNFRLNPNQHWYYIILVNANDPTPAGKIVLKNLDMFDFDTGDICDYFLPGFICTGRKIILGDDLKYFRCFTNDSEVFIERYGYVPFFGRDFAQFYKDVEVQTKRWKYSGRCELLLFNINDFGKISLKQFYNYDLDDIVLNNGTITEFIRKTIIIAQEGYDKAETKRRLDSLYYDMIMPRKGQENYRYLEDCIHKFEQSDFSGKQYCFLSYSTKDIDFVKSIYDILGKHGIKCWMAPFDIPSGTSYAYIIEQAIKNASYFILILSKNTLSSIWCEKELLRAINYFQRNEPNKICVIWGNTPFSIDGTAYALPLENVQIRAELNNQVDNCYRICAIVDPEVEQQLLFEKEQKNIKLCIKEKQKELSVLYKIKNNVANIEKIKYSRETWKRDNCFLKIWNLIEKVYYLINAINYINEKIDCFYQLKEINTQKLEPESIASEEGKKILKDRTDIDIIVKNYCELFSMIGLLETNMGNEDVFDSVIINCKKIISSAEKQIERFKYLQL